ncbi:S49 family peptidase [Caldimonas brevitalea]|uniref:Peptidase S49 n=1 Tax=Caldimonas brevitalea TaxID=413882 RepID=A0A0G3BT08_9BURK|nr:S49 family peptidase [Caldimonas brevitalea]AKJ31143.1 peptidase S49 [Caldimonas brevitalea]
MNSNDPGDLPDVQAEPVRAPAAASAPAAPSDTALVAQLARAYLDDRRRERRWRIFFRLAWLLVALTVLALGYSQRAATNAQTGPHTALIDVRGEIAVDAEASAENLLSALRNAFEDAGAQAVVLRINSPGGSPVQAGIINEEIRRLKELHKKKVYAVVEEVCASGAYYIAVAADEIYVDKASIVGSIGVLMDSFGFTGLMDKLGIERRLLTAGEHKGFLDPFSPQSETEKAYAKAMLDQIHQQFISVVKEGRGNRLKPEPQLFSGLFWNGEQAVALGLVDHFGTLDYVAREVVKAEEVIDYTPRENVAERLVKRFGAAIGSGAVQALRSAGSLR